MCDVIVMNEKTINVVDTVILLNKSPPLLNVKRPSGAWPYAVTPSIDQALHYYLFGQFQTVHRNMSGL